MRLRNYINELNQIVCGGIGLVHTRCIDRFVFSDLNGAAKKVGIRELVPVGRRTWTRCNLFADQVGRSRNELHGTAGTLSHDYVAGQDNYVEILWNTGKWNDAVGNVAQPYVVEYENAIGIPEPATGGLSLVAVCFVTHVRRRNRRNF